MVTCISTHDWSLVTQSYAHFDIDANGRRGKHFDKISTTSFYGTQIEPNRSVGSKLQSPVEIKILWGGRCPHSSIIGCSMIVWNFRSFFSLYNARVWNFRSLFAPITSTESAETDAGQLVLTEARYIGVFCIHERICRSLFQHDFSRKFLQFLQSGNKNEK